MTYGISVQNIYGGTQIDNLYANYYMVASGTTNNNPIQSPSFLTTWQWAAANAVTVNFTNTSGQYPLLFFQYVPFSGTGYISGTTLTITSVNSGSGILGTNNILYPNGGIQSGTSIVSQLSGTSGGVGTYQITPSQNVSTTSITTDDVDNTCTLFSAQLTSPTSFRAISRKQIFAPYLQYSSSFYVVGTFNWRAYIPQSTITPSSVQTGYGLNVYTASGAISYSSNRSAQSMRIQGFYETQGILQTANDIPETFCQQNMLCENNAGARQTGQARYPFVLVNPTTIGFIFNGGDPSGTDTYGILVGGKTNSAGNRIIGSICDNVGFIDPIGNSTYYLAAPCKMLYGFFSYNSSTGILNCSFPDYGYQNSATAEVRDFPTGVQFVFTTGYDSLGYTLTNQLIPRSATKVARTSIDVNIGTGIVIDPSNPSATSWSYQFSYRRAKSIIYTSYDYNSSSTHNVRNIAFATNTLVLAD
jgi:hypothetical protein